MKTSLLLSKINYFIIAVLLFSSFTLYAQPKREFRATWLQTVWAGDFPKTSGSTNQITELKTKIASMKSANLNATCFQVRSMCDAMYNSAYEPWSKVLTGTRGVNPGYDPLAVAITEAHNLGIELHVWLNPYRYESTAGTNGNMDIRKNHPDWLLTFGTADVILDPGNPEVIAYIANVVKDIVSKYDIDGVLFDDYFYPYAGTSSTLDQTSQDKWKPSSMSISDWRRSNVNKMVAAVYNAIQETKPWVRFGVSPFGIWTTTSSVATAHNLTLPSGITGGNMYEQIYCDPIAWMEEGTVDYISPQLYWPTTSSGQDYDVLCPWWSNVTKTLTDRRTDGKKIHFYSSMSRSSNGNAETNLEIARTRTSDKMGAPGHIFFNTTSFLANSYPADLISSSGKFYRQALPPAIDWKNHATLPAPTNVSANGTSLTWQYNGTTWTTYDGSVSRPVRFVIYKYTKGTNSEDAMANPANLLGFSYTTAFTLPEAYNSSYTYAVRTMDRYGNEFGAGYLNANSSYTIPADGAANFNTTAEWSKTQSGSDYLATGDKQRSIAVWESTLFIPNTNLPDTNAGTISMINAATGTLRKTLTLTGASGYSLFCIRITDKGEVLLGNSRTATSDLFIYRCDTTSGVCTSIGTITATNLGRTDYFDIYGNLTNGYIVAASNTGNTAYVSIKDGTIASTATLFSSAHTGATSVNAFKRNCNSFFVAGVNQQDHKLFIKTNNTSLASIAFGNAAPASITGDLRGVGGVCFRFKGREYYACAENRRGSIKLLDISAGVDNAIQIGSATADLGTGANGCCTVGICAEVHSQYVMIYVLAPNNGLAAYKLTLSSPVETVSVTNNTTGNSATFNGTTSILSGCRSEVGFQYRKLFSTTIYSVTATDGSSFSAAASNLEALTYYVVRAYVKTPGGNYIYGGPLIFKTPAVPPTVTTSDATDITTTTAILHGAATKGTLSMTETGFAWKVSGGTYAKQAATLSSDTLTYTLTGLSLGTTYYVKAYATTANGDTYGNEITFSTLSIVPPTVTTNDATNKSYTGATLNGAVVKGDLDITNKGFEWKKVGDANYTTVSKGAGAGTITHNLTGLQANTQYTYRAYGTTSGGKVIGEDKTFTTLTVTPPTITTTDASNLGYTSATLNGSVVKGDKNITDKGFEWKKVGDVSYTTVSKGANAGSITNDLTGLQANTQYTYHAYGSTEDGKVIGEDKTFTTLTITPPSVTTSAATEVSYTSAKLNGTLVDGSYPINAFGFEYKITGAPDYTQIAATREGANLTATINTLKHNTGYTFRSYVTTQDGTLYGDELTFKILYNQLVIQNGESKPISTPFEGDLVFYHGGQIGNTIDNTIEVTGVVQYVQSFTRNLWYTIIFPFDVTKVTYGKNQEILPYRNGSGKFLLKQHNDNTSMNFIERWEDTPTPPAGIIIAKNVPYIIQVQSLVLNNREITFHSANSTHSIGNKTFVLYDNGNTTAFNYFGNNTLRPQTIGTCYIIEDQLFRRQDGTTSVPAFECYVQATPTVMKSMPYIGIMKEAGGTTETANTLYPYTLQTWSDNANVYIRSTVDQDIAIYNINGACLRKISLEKGETVSLQLPNAIYLLIGSQCEKPFKIVF